MTPETVSVTPPPLLAVSRDNIRAALMQWITDSRTGDNATRSYAETATLPADQLVDEGTDRLWQMLEAQGLQMPLFEDAVTGTLLPGEEPTPLVGAVFVAGEDIGAGQIVTFNDAGQIVGVVEDLGTAPVIVGEDAVKAEPVTLEANSSRDAFGVKVEAKLAPSAELPPVSVDPTPFVATQGFFNLG